MHELKLYPWHDIICGAAISRFYLGSMFLPRNTNYSGYKEHVAWFFQLRKDHAENKHSEYQELGKVIEAKMSPD
jgi:hypothetical protein